MNNMEFSNGMQWEWERILLLFCSYVIVRESQSPPQIRQRHQRLLPLRRIKEVSWSIGFRLLGIVVLLLGAEESEYHNAKVTFSAADGSKGGLEILVAGKASSDISQGCRQLHPKW